MSDSGLETGPNVASRHIADFAFQNSEFYAGEFKKIQDSTGFVWSWNTMAAISGPIWGAARGVWGFFWIFLVLELFALVQIGRGLWGELGADQLAKLERALANIAKREAQAADLLAKGDAAGAESKLAIAENLKKVAARAQEQADLAATEASTILLGGLAILAVVKLLEGLYANIAYEALYLKWRANPQSQQVGIKTPSIIFGAAMTLAIVPLTLLRFTVTNPD